MSAPDPATPALPGAEDRPQPDGSDIRKMTREEIDPVAHSLAQAFYDDPHMSWVFRDDETRLQRLQDGFATFTRRVWLGQDEAYTHERLIGGAIWMPPETWHMSFFAQLRSMPATIRAVRGALPRLMKVLTYMERKHPHEPHWYLPVVGVATAWQGRGFGSALLRPVLERCDAEGVPAYLEASTPRNRALYERNGFEVVEECRYVDDGPPMWLMWRVPRATAPAAA
jgi:ribosomal protein S18 acetylase RimI-like enzyme